MSSQVRTTPATPIARGVSTTCLRASLLLATGLSLPFVQAPQALAQPAPPPGAADQAGDQGTDPPAIAGRLAAIAGQVSFHAAGQTDWTQAALNFPVTNLEGFWTEPTAAATIQIAGDTLVMDGSTQFEVTTLDVSQIAASEPQGAVFLDLTSLATGQTVAIQTPRGTVQIATPGRYEIVAGDTDDATLVSVVEGAAHVAGTNLAMDIGPQQTATIGGTDPLQGSVGPLQQDSFLQAQLRLPAPPPPPPGVPAIVRDMTGAADLAAYGSWSQTASYGQVWYPRDVPAGWAPYRNGHWAYVHPWGWTWVDNARWGFAPFHYGRWVQEGGRWGWIAGGGGPVTPGAYPVYAPALVTFITVGAPALSGIGFAAGAGAPAWIPLGPREPYYPWFHVRADYFARVNRPYGVPAEIIQRGPTYVENIHNVTVNRTNVFINARGATVAPEAAFTGGRPLMAVARPLPERALAEAHPVFGRLAVRPTALTPNLPPATARRFNIAVPAHPAVAHVAGPKILPPGQALAHPALRPAALPGNLRAVPAGAVRAGVPAPAARRGDAHEVALPQGHAAAAETRPVPAPAARSAPIPEGRSAPIPEGRSARGPAEPPAAARRATPAGAERPVHAPQAEARPAPGHATPAAPTRGRAPAEVAAHRTEHATAVQPVHAPEPVARHEAAHAAPEHAAREKVAPAEHTAASHAEEARHTEVPVHHEAAHPAKAPVHHEEKPPT
jgi:hypothetical protein